MKYDIARAILSEAIEQLDEKKLFDPVFGHAGIDRNPKARKFNPQTARPNKVKKRNFEMRVGRAGYGLSNPESRSVNDGRYMLRDRINEARVGKSKDPYAVYQQMVAKKRELGNRLYGSGSPRHNKKLQARLDKHSAALARHVKKHYHAFIKSGKFTLDEGAYVPKEREARWQRKGSRKLLRNALARGDKSGAAEWMDNIKDAEQYIPKKKRN